MKRRISLIIAIALVGGALLAPAASAGNGNSAKAKYVSAKNHAAYWGDNCTKIDEEQPSDSWISDGYYAMVILKSSLDNTVITYVDQGQVVTTNSGKDISHIIVCDGYTD